MFRSGTVEQVEQTIMKRCPECRRDYYDDTLLYCLDDGSALLEGPASHKDAAKTDLKPVAVFDEGVTRILPADKVNDAIDIATTTAKLTWIATVVIVIIFSLGAFGLYKTFFSSTKQQSIRSIAVLPLENLSGDPTQDYFADGMTEMLIGNLSQIRSLTVISRRSVMRFKGTNDSIPDIANQLGIDAVIEGTVQKANGRIKITTQLIQASTNALIWSRSYESELTDVLKMQSDVAQALVGELHAKLTPLEQNRLSSAKSIDPGAHEAYLQGSYHIRRLNEKDLALAVSYFEEAIKIEPGYADAYAGLSRAWSERGIWGGVGPLKADPSARAAAEKALQLDPDNSSAHTALASILRNRDYNWKGSEEESRRAIELDPGSAEAYVEYSWLLQCLGRHDEVVPKMEMAKKIDPISTQIESDFGRMLYRARKYTEAEVHLKRSIELDSNNYSAYGRLGDVYVEQMRFDDAIAIFEKAQTLSKDDVYNLRIATVFARMGKRQEALRIIDQVTKVYTLERARVYTSLGDADNAFRVLSMAFDSNDALLTNAKEDPGLVGLHGDPRWKEFLRRLNFPDI